MKIEKFEKLGTEMESGTYEENYKGIERTLFYSSFLGNIAGVIFAFFFVNQAVSSVHHYVSGQQYILPAIIIVFLSAYELLKRFVFRRFVVNLLTNTKKFTIKNIVGMLFVVTLIAGSFWLSVNGAKQIVDTSKEVAKVSDSTYVTQKKFIDSTYNAEIKVLSDKITFCYDNAKKRDSKWGLSRSEKEDTRRWEADIKALRIEQDQKLEDLKKTVDTKTTTELVTVKSNMVTFFVLSSFIELLILIGVGFNAYYWFYSYNEYKLKITRNPNYKKYKIFVYLLNVLYQSGAKVVDDVVPNDETFIKMIKMHDSDASEKDAEDFMLIAFQLGIVKQPNDNVKLAVSYEEAENRIKRYLIIN